MPMFRNSFEQANRTMSNIIPLFMRMKQDKEELAYKDKILKLKEQELQAEAAERAQKVQNEAQKIKIKTLVDLTKEAGKSGDSASMQTLAPQIENLIPGLSMPKEQTPKPSLYGGIGSGQTLNSLVDQGNDIRYLVNPQKKTEDKFTVAGLEKKTNRAVIKDTKGNLLYQDTKEPYRGGQLQSITEPSMIATMNTGGGFADLDEESKKYWYEQYAADKNALPPFYYRDPKSKNAFTEGFAKWQKSRGVTGGEAVAGRETIKSYATSLKTQQKNRGMMGSFVGNINKQLGKIEEISRDVVNRVGIRALDLPLRELNTRFVGSGSENVFKAYLKEISTEIAKLSQGSAASVQQLPEENRKEWDRIHDPNLSFNELKKVLEGTRDMANMRLQSVDEELSRTINEMEGVTQSRKSKTIKEKSGHTTNKKEDPLGIR
jgi:hypothetical protein